MNVYDMKLLVYKDDPALGGFGLVSEKEFDAFFEDFLDLVVKHKLTVGGGACPDRNATNEILARIKEEGH